MITIGRAPDSTVTVDSRWDTVSNRHADIRREGDNLLFVDHSTNGTMVNGQKVHNRAVNIYPGDKIVLANVFELSWDVIQTHFPDTRRPTVIQNIRGANVAEKASEQTATVPPSLNNRMTQSQGSPAENGSHGHKTERFQGAPSAEPAGRPGQMTERFSSDDERAADNDYGTSSLRNYESDGYSRSQIDRELESWNWGAFLGSPLWGLFNGVWWSVLILLFAGIPYVGQVMALWLAVYLGYNGNRMAWRKAKNRSFRRFKKRQRAWIFIGIAVFIVYVAAMAWSVSYTLTLF